tara:strand:+ start:1278 stop:1448 length:171 start_codon:yes stop_codon:yes gene_type:complete
MEVNIMKKVTKCKTCNQDFKIKGGYRICGNLGCVKYNQRYGGRYENARQEKKEKNA